MPNQTNIKSFCPIDRAAWREWLLNNHQTEQSVYLIYWKKSSGRVNLVWEEAVEEALCFGWIDSVKKSMDQDRFMQLFTPRKPNSNWSKINKDKITILSEAGKMHLSGLKSVSLAKENGSWTKLDAIEALIVPQDLQEEMDKNSVVASYYEQQSKSVKKSILYWLFSAKRENTRRKRLDSFLEVALKGEKLKLF